MPLSSGLQANLPYIKQYAAQFGVPLKYAIGVARTEDSTGNPNAVSTAGAIGQMQLMPATAQALGVNPRNNVQNIQGGMRYLSQLYKTYGSWPLALAAYNDGPNNVNTDLTTAFRGKRQTAATSRYQAIAPLLPRATTAYVDAITGLKSAGGTGAGTNATVSSGVGANGWTSFLVWLHKAENAPRLSATPWSWGSDAVGIMEWAGVKLGLIVLGMVLLLIGVLYMLQSVPSIGGSAEGVAGELTKAVTP
ncbi:MAG: lytic transglycosylase domain-containing protein [Acidobacteriaceae bacterium]